MGCWPSGKTWIDVVLDRMSDPARKEKRIRDKQWRDLELEYEGKTKDDEGAAKAPKPDVQSSIDAALWAAMKKARSENVTKRSRVDLLGTTRLGLP